jgi:hypothetical protein
MSTIEFDFDTQDGRTIVVYGQQNGQHVYFKTYWNDKKISKGSLTQLDCENIEQFIIDNSENDIEYESDAFERQND